MQLLTNRPLEMVNTVCCICESDNAEIIGTGSDFEYGSSPDVFKALLCKTCDLVYLSPRPAISEFEKIYPSTYHAFNFSEKEFGIVHKIRSWLEAKRLLKACKDLPADARILDVGCGDGFHLKLLRQYGERSWNLEGVDFDARAVEMGINSGLQVHQGSIQSVDLAPQTYDLAFMIQTIEHLDTPVEVMQTIYKLLKPGGKLLIVTDNTNSLDFGISKKRYWGGYHFPRHWNLFNEKSLTSLAHKTGYEVALFETQVSPVNWVYTIHNWLVDKKAPGWLINRFSLKSTVSLSAFTMLDMVLQKFKRGALLRMILVKPAS